MNAEASPSPSPTKTTQTEPEYLSRSQTRFLVLCIVTFGFYQVYWFYKNWKAIQIARPQKMWPFWRAIFAPFWAWPLFKEIHADATKHGFKPEYSAGQLAFAYIAIEILGTFMSFSDTQNFYVALLAILVTVMSAFVLLPVQQAINFHRSKIKGGDKPMEQTSGETIIIVVGVIIGLLALASYAVPMDDTEKLNDVRTTRPVER